jgi:TM2 domain-containing membrane protein YozV
MMATMRRCSKCGASQIDPQNNAQRNPPVQIPQIAGVTPSTPPLATTSTWQSGGTGFSSGSTSSISVSTEGKNVVIAYLLWWFLGFFGIHRFYLGRVGTGITQLVLLIVGLVTAVFLIGYIFLIVLLVWWLLDAYFVYAIVKESKSGTTSSPLNFQTTSKSSRSNDLDTLARLHQLHQQGAITQQEYNNAKASLMSGLGP